MPVIKQTGYYIPPPDDFIKKVGSKSGGSISFYYTGFPTVAN